MKIVLSRKGFDSASGGVPSAIMPDMTMYSFPIPDITSPIKYKDIVPYGGLVSQLTRGKVANSEGAHLDPDLVHTTIIRQPGWRPVFGQCGAGQRLLERESIGPGDLFLFFGWFRQVEQCNSGYRYLKGAADLHVLWGWMQVGQILRVGVDDVPEWANRHPHVARPEERRNNTIYIASDNLTAGAGTQAIPGAGAFIHYDHRLNLTAPNRSRSIWSLPGWFHPKEGQPPLGYHCDTNRWFRDGDRTLLRTVARGQEFVLDASEYPEAIDWARNLIEMSYDQNERPQINSISCLSGAITATQADSHTAMLETRPLSDDLHQQQKIE